MTALQRQFNTYNAQWFQSSLPPDTIVKWTRSKPDILGCCEDSTNEIFINAAFKKWDSIWKLTLLHEMAHLATAVEKAHHGPRWLREMRRLARAGAFDALW